MKLRPSNTFSVEQVISDNLYNKINFNIDSIMAKFGDNSLKYLLFMS